MIHATLDITVLSKQINILALNTTVRTAATDARIALAVIPHTRQIIPESHPRVFSNLKRSFCNYSNYAVAAEVNVITIAIGKFSERNELIIDGFDFCYIVFAVSTSGCCSD
mmetsp:Transcript_15674/g.20708  ORF Transcript_15674/g.20708 Transcript_15674/m.20708 type:complete len:111 (-) Transcript_15674:293-625(-)